MLEKNALEWLDMGEGLEKLDIYKKNKLSHIYTFFKVLFRTNNFPLSFYVILQSIYYIQICCTAFPKNDDTDYSEDYLYYIFQYMSIIFLPQNVVDNITSFRIIIIIITILLIILLFCFFVIFFNMNNDKQSNFFRILTFLVNIFLEIILIYLVGPIFIINMIPFQCKNGNNPILNSECLTKGTNIIYIILSIINIIFYLGITILVSIFYKEIGKIGSYTPKIQINNNFELYGGLLKIFIFIIFFIYNNFLDNKKIYLLIYHLIILIIICIFSYYIFNNVFYYDNIMNCVVQLGGFLTLWFCLVITLKDIFEFKRISLFLLLGWIIISSLTITLFYYKKSTLILNSNIFEMNNIKDIEMIINFLLEILQVQEGTNKTILYGFYYKFREYLISNPELKEKFNYLSNAVYLKNLYNNKSIINGYYILYLIYDYHINQNRTNNLLSIHFCYFLINHLKNTISAIYRCSKMKADSIFTFYYKFILAENIKDYLVDLKEADNKENSIQNVQFSSLILYHLYQNLIRMKISELAENQMNYYDYFKNFSVGAKSSLGFLKVGKTIIKIRDEIKQIWDKILILNPFCQEIRREYMTYIKEILNDEDYYEKELKNHRYIQNYYFPYKKSFYFKLFDNLNSALFLTDYNDNKILYITPNFKKIILLSNESNDLTVSSLIPSAIEKFHYYLVNDALLYSNIEYIFTTQANIMLRTKNNTLLYTKFFAKEIPNMSYGLIFIVHLEKILTNEFKIILDKDLKINGYSDEASSLKKENYENYGLIPSFLGTPIFAVIPEILLYLTNKKDNIITGDNDSNKELYLKNRVINQRGSIYKYNMPSPSKSIIDRINSIINYIKKNDINLNDINKKLKENQKLVKKDDTNNSDKSVAFDEEKSIGENYLDLIKEIEKNARKSFKIEYEIIERRFLNDKYRYYLITINKDIYNYENEIENESITKKNKITSNENLNKYQSGFKENAVEPKEIKINNGKLFTNKNNEQKAVKIEQDIKNEKQEIEKKDKNNTIKIEKKEEIIKEIKQKISDKQLNTKYSLTMIYLGILTFILLYIFLIFNHFNGKKKLTQISNYLIQNLYYNETRICLSHANIVFFNFILYKRDFIKNFTYNNKPIIDVYKEIFKNSVNNLFELTKKNKEFFDDYSDIFSTIKDIFINSPYIDNDIKINMTISQIIKLIISESIKFEYSIEEYLYTNNNEDLYYSMSGNIDNLTHSYLFFNYNGFNNKEIEKKVSKNFNSIPWIIIAVSIIIIIIILLYSYIIYILNYYENFFLVKIINLSSKEFEDYLKHFEELKFKLKSLENDEEIHEETASEGGNPKLVYQYTQKDKNEEEEENNLQNLENNNNENIESMNIDNNNNSNKNEEDNKTKENSKKKKKSTKKDRVKKIKLIEQKNLKIKKMLRLLLIQNFLNGIKIGLAIILPITYYMFHTVYLNQKIDILINFNRNLETIESVFTESYISFLNLKKQIIEFEKYFLKKNVENRNYTLVIQSNKNYSSPDFGNLIMEVLKDFDSMEPGEIETFIYQLYTQDSCEILYNLNNDNYDKCKDFWFGVLTKGLQQVIIEMGSQYSILLSLFTLVNDNKEYIENILDGDSWRNFDYFMIHYLYDSFEKSMDLFNELRIKYIAKNEGIFVNIFYYYLIIYFLIALIFLYFSYSVIVLFNEFLNFIAIIPVKILIEEKDINDVIINLSRKIF